MYTQNKYPSPWKTNANMFIHGRQPKFKQFTLVVCIMVAILISGCVPQQPRFYSAFIRNDGRIQTNASLDGISWPAESRFLHPEVSSFGPGIAATPKGVVALAFFQKNTAGRQFLVVKQGLGSRTWESAVSSESLIEEGDVQSAPAIAHIQDNVFALAWRDGNRIRTASFDANVQQGSKFIGTGIVGSDADGAPSIAFDGDRALMIWLSKNRDNARGITFIGRAIGTLENNRLIWQAIDDLELTFPADTNLRNVTGSPSIFYDSSRFFLAVIALTSDGAETHKLVVFDSDDGGEYQFRGMCILDRGDVESEIALAANQGSLVVLRAPSGTGSPNGAVFGSLPGSCQEVAWSTAFGDQGNTGGQKPAITHNTSQSDTP